MTLQPLAVKPEDSVVYAAKILYENSFNGLPVVDENNIIKGIVTEYDLISKGESLHLPTLINILGNIDVYKKDSSLVKDDLKHMLILKVKEVMNSDPLVVQDEAPIQYLAELFANHHRVNPIPVIDREKKLVGIVSRFDLVRFFVGGIDDQKIEPSQSNVLDKKVEGFLNNFEKKFVFVSKGRARLWPVIGLFSAIVGFIVAFAIILRIATR